MKCDNCFYLSTASTRRFCYLHLKEVTEPCKNFKEKECKLCINGINKKKCLIFNKSYPNVCDDFRRFKNWAMK